MVRQGLWSWRQGLLTARAGRAWQVHPSYIPRHVLTLVPGYAQDSLHLPVTFGSSCPPPRMASVALVGHQQLQQLQPLPYLHPRTEGHSSGGGQDVGKPLRPDNAIGTGNCTPSRPTS